MYESTNFEAVLKFLNRQPYLVALACVLVLGALGPDAGRAQERGEETLALVEDAFASGRPERLLGRAGDRVDITIFGAGEMYSRSQARYVLAEFFREHPPSRFVFDEPSRREGNWFASGRYWYLRDREPLSVYVRLRQTGRGWELREIRVDRRPGD